MAQREQDRRFDRMGSDIDIYAIADSDRAPNFNFTNLDHSNLTRGGPCNGRGEGRSRATTAEVLTHEAPTEYDPFMTRSESMSSERPDFIRGQEGDEDVEEVAIEIGDMGYHRLRDVRRATTPQHGCPCRCKCPGCFCHPFAFIRSSYVEPTSPAENADDSPPESLMVEIGESLPPFFDDRRSSGPRDMSGVLHGIQGGAAAQGCGRHDVPMRTEDEDSPNEYPMELSGSGLDV